MANKNKKQNKPKETKTNALSAELRDTSSGDLKTVSSADLRKPSK